MEDFIALNIPIQRSNKAIVVPIRFEITSETLKFLRNELIKFIDSASEGARGGVFDLKGVHVVDGEDFCELVGIIQICEMMGLRAYVCGLEPGLVAAIVLIGIDTSKINAVFELSEALELINRL